MRLLIVLLIISVLGNLVGLYALYKYFKKTDQVISMKEELAHKHETLQIANSYLPHKFVFIHHSVGRNWLRDGGLLDSLTRRGIAIQSATNRQGCAFAEETDMHNWVPKFKENMNAIIHFDKATEGFYNDSVENQIIMFKPCYPNSNIVAKSSDNNADDIKTLENYKKIFTDLTEIFKQYPDKKFLYITAPPMVPANTTLENAARAREFNTWLLNDYLAAYKLESGLDNLYIFDLFDVLADNQNVLKQEFRRAENDSHPNKNGSLAATKVFLKYLADKNYLK